MIAKYIQTRIPSNFYVFIAGAYGALNAQSPEEAKKLAKNKKSLEEAKKQLLTNVFKNLGLNGKVYTTYDLWKDKEYWEILQEVIGKIDPEEISRKVRKKGMPMREFPLEILSSAREVLNGELSYWSSTAFYVPAEIAEAIWFKQKLDVSMKIGPSDSETLYDEFISKYNMGIIGMTQPTSFESGKLNEKLEFVPPSIRSVVPYIGREYQNRVSFSDNPADIAIIRKRNTPSFNRALKLAKFYQKIKSEEQKNDPFSIFDLIKLARIKK